MAKATATTETPTRTVTIVGAPVTVSLPFAEGHVCTAAEAKALNQTRCENIGNNLRKRIKELAEKDGSFSDEALAKIADMAATVDAEYIFTLASSGGSSSVVDPFERECRALATSVVNNNIKAKGMTIKAYKEQEGGADRYAELVAQVMEMEQVKAKAQEILDSKSGIGGITI